MWVGGPGFRLNCCFLPPSSLFTHSHTHIYTYTHAHAYTHTHTHTHTHKYTYTHAHTHTTHTHTHTHTPTHTRTHTHAHAHTHTLYPPGVSVTGAVPIAPRSSVTVKTRAKMGVCVHSTQLTCLSFSALVRSASLDQNASTGHTEVSSGLTTM